jgi:nitrogen fixation protein NifU and related proteins
VSYSEQVMCHFWRPHNNRVMANADAVGVAGVPGNGPYMVLYLRLDGDVIAEAAFQTHGCAPSVAAGSLLTARVSGERLEDASRWTEAAIDEALGGLPPHKAHCAALAASALRTAISNVQRRTT